MASVAADSPIAATAFGAGYRLLVVDDEETVRKVLGLVLRPTGFAIESAENVASALRFLEEGSFDVVVTDKNLPDGSGLDVVRFVADRKLETSIVMVTGYGSHDSALEALRLGVSDYLSKPFGNLDEVRACVRQALQRRLDRRQSSVLARAAVPPESAAARRLRFQVELKVRFVLADGSVSQQTLCSSLSMVDLFVETAAALPVGLRVKMRLDLPDEVLEIDGVVLRIGEGRRNRGVRIQLVDVDRGTESVLASFLELERAALRASTSLRAPEESAAPPPADHAETVSNELSAIAEATPEIPAGRDPEIDALIRRWLPAEPDAEASAPAPSSPASDAPPAPVEARFELDAFALFRSMQPEQKRFASLMNEKGKAERLEDVDLSMLDPSHPGMPTVVGVLPGGSATTDEVEARLRERYKLDDSILDVDALQAKYGIDDALFDDEADDEESLEGTPAPKPAVASAASPRFTIPEPPWQTNPKPTTAEQRRAFAVDLRRRAEESMLKGLLVKAATDLALAVVFDPTNAGLKKLHEEVRRKAAESRAEATFREGLQQLAMGDENAAAQLLLSACKAHFEMRYVLACTKVLLRIASADSLREARTLLRAAVTKEPESAPLHVLLGALAEAEGLPKVAVRLYRKALELEPGNAQATERCAILDR